MTYTNLPPTLFEMFGSLDDRVRKLETGPNLAYTTGYDALQQAQGAQNGSIQAYSVATQAQIQAVEAGVQANIAQSQATVAQATASFAQALSYSAQATANSASAQATVAQNTANGKNKVYYSLVTPGSTANTAGDIWFQYSGSGLVIAQYVGLGGTSWQQQTITQAVIGNLDAGKVTTGILNAIEITAGSGSQVFRVTPTGYLSAQGAYIKGNITADSGTFNGTVNATAGYFGSGGNYWSITSTGITGVGTATIVGGLIQGSSIQVPQTSPLFQVFSDGSIQSTAGTIGGVTIGSSTLTGGTIQTSSGSTSIKMVGSTNSLDFYTSGSLTGQIYPYSSNGIFLQYGTSSTNPNILIGAGIVSLYANSSNIINLQTVGGTTITSSSVTVNSSLTVSSGYKFNSPDIYSTTNSNAANVFVTSSGYLQRSTASSQRYKTNIVDLVGVTDLEPKKLLNLRPRAFEYKAEYLPDDDPRSGKQIPGFIAEEVAEVYGIAADLVEDKPETWNERMIVPGILALVQDLEKRLTKLEGNNG